MLHTLLAFVAGAVVGVVGGAVAVDWWASRKLRDLSDRYFAIG